MIKCIFTNIKNEHRYIEEWINYHIKLGFNKFILYEDYDSISHADILSKYNDIVDIELYDYVLKKDSLEFKDLTCFKHVFENYTDIDWLIKLDPDEFLVLPQMFTTVDDMLVNVNKDINQLAIPWKLYNASGFINQPDGGKYNVFDTYLISIDKSKLCYDFKANTSNNEYGLCKSFIRYKHYKPTYDTVLNIDDISLSFPYIIFSDENTVMCDKYNIFINHYITKSFQEFYEKLRDKGEYNLLYYRKLGDFFVLNPDMIELIPEIENKFDVNIFTFETKLNGDRKEWLLKI